MRYLFSVIYDEGMVKSASEEQSVYLEGYTPVISIQRDRDIDSYVKGKEELAKKPLFSRWVSAAALGVPGALLGLPFALKAKGSLARRALPVVAGGLIGAGLGAASDVANLARKRARKFMDLPPKTRREMAENEIDRIYLRAFGNDPVLVKKYFANEPMHLVYR